ncbi:MAG: hypothetical protein AAF438_07080 [Pseudomonadota bacterium]
MIERTGVLLLVVAYVSGCSNTTAFSPIKSPEEIIGTWGVPSEQWTFYKDGTGTIESYDGSFAGLTSKFRWNATQLISNESFELGRDGDALVVRRTIDGRELRLKRWSDTK